MDSNETFSEESVWQEKSFGFIKPDDFKAFGIDPADIPLGTFAALKHPPPFQSRFGGNAYGFGFLEVYDRLEPEDIKFVESIALNNPEDLKSRFSKINQIYKKLGLLVRFSNEGKPYYLIPAHLVSSTISFIKSKIDEITKILRFHRKKYFKEHYDIGLMIHDDSLIIDELSLRFKEHRFVVLDTIDKLMNIDRSLDLVILPMDPYEIVLMGLFGTLSSEKLSKKRLDQYATYMFWKIYNVLKPGGEIFIVANRYTPKVNRTTEVTFKSQEEKKNFALFCHIFKTKKYYGNWDHPLEVNVFDLQKYLSGFYVEPEIVDKLLEGKSIDDMSFEEIQGLSHMNLQLVDRPFLGEQEKNWPRLLSIYFDEIFLKTLVPQSINEDWEKRFSFTDYRPYYMMLYLGQKKSSAVTLEDMKAKVVESKLAGCSEGLLADYRNSFEYVIQTLRVLKKLKKGDYKDLPQTNMDRLTQPLENKRRRFSALNHVMKLTTKIGRLEKIKDYLNPDGIEGSGTKVLKNLEDLTFYGFHNDEIREIVLIVLGHTTLGRIISGKMSEETLKPVSDLARTYPLEEAINLLRYCRLMTMAEIEAARGTVPTHEELALLFDLYESAVRIVANRDLDWNMLLDEKISSLGGIHYKVIHRLLMMMDHSEFLKNWHELRDKGKMEKECLADYDENKLARIENVIELVATVEQFEDMYLKFDPLQLPVFYRKFLGLEFHGTGRLFERMQSRQVFILLWIIANVARGEIINFNPILADLDPSVIQERVKLIEMEAGDINIDYLDLPFLNQFSEQLYKNGSSFVVGTGFQLNVDSTTEGIEIAYIDVSEIIRQTESLLKKLAGCLLSEISVTDLRQLDMLFDKIESFYQSHLNMLGHNNFALALPLRQRMWFEQIQALRQELLSNILSVIFPPENVFTDLDLLYSNAPSLLRFILPEMNALKELDISWHIYMTKPVIHYILHSTKKLQSLIRGDGESFQDTGLMHRLAQREFGPMETGTVGVTDGQIVELERTIKSLSDNQPLFNGLIKSFVFQDIGRDPLLREKYKEDINPAKFAQAGAVILEKENIAYKYGLDEKGKAYLTFLVRHHSLFQHILRGEISFFALEGVLDPRDKDLFDAFFVSSLIMLSAIREDLMLEDLADRLFQIQGLCHKIIDGKTSFEEHMAEMFHQKGELYCALEGYRKKGLPEGMSPVDYVESATVKGIDEEDCIGFGSMIFAMERYLRLRGIRYVEFIDLLYLIMKVPLRFIYKKRKFSNMGYATFEREIYEAFRIYNTLQNLSEQIRHFILGQLTGDKVRLYGYEKVSGYLSYENQIKLLFIGLLGGKRIKREDAPICLNFLSLCRIIDRRYEAVNDFLNNLSIGKLWGDDSHLYDLFDAEVGLVLVKEEFANVLSFDFKENINMAQKISHMKGIDSVEQLKNYFHYSLRSIIKHPFHTDDYEFELEKAYKERLTEITDAMVSQTKKQMDLIDDFEELHDLENDLLERAWAVGLSNEQKYKLNDLYELRKNNLMRKKLNEIESFLEKINDMVELTDYWESTKWFLQGNRRFFGKEFENIVAA
ncbi:MAG: hypothetical protein SV686_17190, partial [Thermodesulfobacteriota bacterium]|nr:hypothetical protein [Thermodesulfobacteriota bacterium]